MRLLELNKSLHDARVSAQFRPTKEKFVSSCVAFLKGAFTEQQLGEMFDSVQTREFESVRNLNERHLGRINEMLFNIVMDDFD